MSWLQHKTPLPPPSPEGLLGNSIPGSWCHPAISFHHHTFLVCLQIFPTSGLFPMSCVHRWLNVWSFNITCQRILGLNFLFQGLTGLTSYCFSIHPSGLSGFSLKNKCLSFWADSVHNWGGTEDVNFALVYFSNIAMVMNQVPWT